MEVVSQKEVEKCPEEPTSKQPMQVTGYLKVVHSPEVSPKKSGLNKYIGYQTTYKFFKNVPDWLPLFRDVRKVDKLMPTKCVLEEVIDHGN